MKQLILFSFCIIFVLGCKKDNNATSGGGNFTNSDPCFCPKASTSNSSDLPDKFSSKCENTFSTNDNAANYFFISNGNIIDTLVDDSRYYTGTCCICKTNLYYIGSDMNPSRCETNYFCRLPQFTVVLPADTSKINSNLAGRYSIVDHLNVVQNNKGMCIGGACLTYKDFSGNVYTSIEIKNSNEFYNEITNMRKITLKDSYNRPYNKWIIKGNSRIKVQNTIDNNDTKIVTVKWKLDT
jgi:hypothetical protein